MNNFFNMDNGFFAVLGKITDLILLSIVWSILCIPIITIGPATTAMYYAVVKVIRRERGYLFREFFKSFRQNFKKGAITGVVLTIIFFVLSYDIFYAYNELGNNYTRGSIMLGVFIALTVLTLCVSIYVFPILSRFEMTYKQLFKASSFMSMRHLPSTILMAVIVIASVLLSIFQPIFIFIAPAGSTFLISTLMERVFKKYMPQTDVAVEGLAEGESEKSEGINEGVTQEEEEQIIRKDEWYLE